LIGAGVDATTAMQQSYARVLGMIQMQATTLGYVQVVTLLSIVVACLIPLPMIMRRPPTGRPASDVPAH
jgi:hypothetical protein